MQLSLLGFCLFTKTGHELSGTTKLLAHGLELVEDDTPGPTNSCWDTVEGEEITTEAALQRLGSGCVTAYRHQQEHQGPTFKYSAGRTWYTWPHKFLQDTVEGEETTTEAALGCVVTH